MTDIPIIMSAPMVRALLDGRKRQTRRLAWRTKVWKEGDFASEQLEEFDALGYLIVGATGRPFKIYRPSPWQRVKPGDRLWVREQIYADRMENFLTGERTTNAIVGYYKADHADCVVDGGFNLSWVFKQKTRPAIHMPRSWSRLTLIVISTKIERLQAISEADAAAEGWTKHPELSTDPEVHWDAARDWFSDLWEDLHGVESWKSNPECVALTFTVRRINIDGMPREQAV